jgi:hypothetical protein
VAGRARSLTKNSSDFLATYTSETPWLNEIEFLEFSTISVLANEVQVNSVRKRNLSIILRCFLII